MLTQQEISDRLEIEHLMTGYSVAVDRHDWDLFDSLFLEEAVIDYTQSTGRRGTRDEWKEWLSEGLPPADKYYHMMAPSYITIDGDTAESHTICYNPMPVRRNGPMVFGHWYHDTLVRTPEGWRISLRWMETCYGYPYPGIAGGGDNPVQHGDAHGSISNLLARYTELIDAGDFQGLADLFGQATLIRNRTLLHGRDRQEMIQYWLDRVHLYHGTPGTKHVTTNVIIQLDEGGRVATARSSYIVFQATEELPLQPVITGRYRDRFELVEDGWIFKEREFLRDQTGDLSKHLKTLPS